MVLIAPAGAEAAPSVYAGSASDGNVSLFQADADGLLTPQTPATIATANADGLAVSPDQNSLYVANSADPGSISQYDIGASGTPVPKSPPTVAAGSFPGGIVVSPEGDSVYVVNNGSSTISQYDVGTDGTLMPKAPATVATEASPFGIAISPDGSSVYATNYVAAGGGSITQYSVGAGGVLAPKTPASVAAGVFPAGIAVSPDGQSAYSTELNSFFVRQWDVAANGTLSPKDPASVGAAQFPSVVVVSPDGSSVYVTGQEADQISQYDVGAGGELAAKTPATVAGGDGPFGIAVDATGQNVYSTAYIGGGELRHYAVGADGGLTLSGTPNDLGSSARMVVVRNDVIAPDASVDSGPSGTVATADASFTFSANEPGSTFECRLDSGGFSPCTSPRSYSSLGEGAHTFAVRATDPWDNAGTPETRSWTVDFPDPPSNEFTFGRVRRDRIEGTAALAVQVPGAGDLALASSKKVRGAQARAEAAGRVTVAIRAAGKAKRKLRRTGRITIRAAVTFSPDGGDPNTQSTTVALKRKRPR